MSAAHTFGQIVREARERLELSQEDLAERAGLHRNAISFFERGERSPSLDSIIAIAKGLDIKPSKLMTRLEKRLQKG
jgi:transcriptional regulator with XRE-family HTH domain